MNAFEAVVPGSMVEAEAAVRASLAEQGFGVLTEIDVAATLAAKLGVHRSALKILGACNPGFAHRALLVDPAAALMLPCNVVLEAVDAGTRVAAIDPRDLMVAPELSELAAEAADALRAAIEVLSPGPPG